MVTVIFGRRFREALNICISYKLTDVIKYLPKGIMVVSIYVKNNSFCEFFSK